MSLSCRWLFSYDRFRKGCRGLHAHRAHVLIEEGPLIERLVSLFARNGTDATAAQPSGDRVCEAHILTPNLILLDLSRAAVHDTNVPRAPREGMNAADAAIFKLAIAQPGADNDGVDTTSVDGPHSDRLLPQEQLLPPERLLPHLLREEPSRQRSRRLTRPAYQTSPSCKWVRYGSIVMATGLICTKRSCI
jgi:hypothetical protein